jgi:hypothetical protein
MGLRLKMDEIELKDKFIKKYYYEFLIHYCHNEEVINLFIEANQELFYLFEEEENGRD